MHISDKMDMKDLPDMCTQCRSVNLYCKRLILLVMHRCHILVTDPIPILFRWKWPILKPIPRLGLGDIGIHCHKISWQKYHGITIYHDVLIFLKLCNGVHYCSGYIYSYTLHKVYII